MYVHLPLLLEWVHPWHPLQKGSLSNWSSLHVLGKKRVCIITVQQQQQHNTTQTHLPPLIVLHLVVCSMSLERERSSPSWYNTTGCLVSCKRQQMNPCVCVYWVVPYCLHVERALAKLKAKIERERERENDSWTRRKRLGDLSCGICALCLVAVSRH